jgi:hypothetical protein
MRTKALHILGPVILAVFVRLHLYLRAYMGTNFSSSYVSNIYAHTSYVLQTLDEKEIVIIDVLIFTLYS